MGNGLAVKDSLAHWGQRLVEPTLHHERFRH
ncbi:MAG: hypothetical protein CM15mP120_16240 [Pseudomonadota bacterium]|nr:MAG: hypothetical protein CM15mP120_16240 [Pseudomonadota bacterium]